MQQFKSYPLFVNDSVYWEEDVRARQIAEFEQKGDYQMVNWLKNQGKSLYEVMEDPAAAGRQSELMKYDRKRAADFEAMVIRNLELIDATMIGRLLLNSFNRNHKFWIIPLDAEYQGECTGLCAAAYTDFDIKDVKDGGGVRVYFPAALEKNTDDVLFHELVHAYRAGRLGFYGKKTTSVWDYQDAEEFVATIMQNMYRELRGVLTYYKSYRRFNQFVLKKEAYQGLSDNSDAIMALRYFVEKEPLGGIISKWKSPSYNPFRDQSYFEQSYLRSISGSGIQRLPAF